MNVHCTPVTLTRTELYFPVDGTVEVCFAREATIGPVLASRKDVGVSAITHLIFTENEALSDAANAMHLRNLKAAAKAYNKAFFAKWVSDDAEFVEAFGRIGGATHHVLMEV